ncbi:MAG: AAA family ATPase, partial [Alphaproteobacteria bacterium]|nr:AAA family ATPase [Alphaproteobacteria bacterium]
MSKKTAASAVIQDFEVLEDTGLRLHDLVGVNPIKAEINRLCHALSNPQQLESFNARAPERILITGERGIGKDRLVNAIAGETSLPIVKASGSYLITHEIDEARKYLGNLVENAREQIETQSAKGIKNPRCLLYVERADAIPEEAMEHFLTSLDTLSRTDQGKIIVITSAFNSNHLTSDFIKHFPTRIHIPLPSIEGRLEILKKIMPPKDKWGKELSLTDIAGRTFGFTFEDIKNTLNRAAMYAQERGVKNRQNIKKLLKADFYKAIDHHAMDSPALEEKRSRFLDESTAIHEAGHAITALLLEKTGYHPLGHVSILPQGDSNGLTWFIDRENQHERSFSAYKADLIISMAGRAAENICFGKELALDGASGDIEAATEIAYNMVSRYGFSD